MTFLGSFHNWYEVFYRPARLGGEFTLVQSGQASLTFNFSSRMGRHDTTGQMVEQIGAPASSSVFKIFSHRADDKTRIIWISYTIKRAPGHGSGLMQSSDN